MCVVVVGTALTPTGLAGACALATPASNESEMLAIARVSIDGLVLGIVRVFPVVI